MPPFSVMQQDVYLAVRTDGLPGGGTWDDPYDASTAAKFDSVMATKISPGQCIRLLPGEFQTNGSSGDGTFSAWAPQDGVRIVGSGMGVTTLKLVNSSAGTLFAIAINFAVTALSGFELSDLTIDCNLDGMGVRTAGAIRVRGSHIYLRRIKVIGYGTKVPASFRCHNRRGRSQRKLRH